MDDVCISAAIAWNHHTTLEMEGVAPVAVHCGNCGVAVPLGAKYCPGCGVELDWRRGIESEANRGSTIVKCARCAPLESLSGYELISMASEPS